MKRIMCRVYGERKQQMQRTGGNRDPDLTEKQEASQGTQSRKKQSIQEELERKPEWAMLRSLDITQNDLRSHQKNLSSNMIRVSF